MSKKQDTNDRRKALKAILAGSGAVAAVKAGENTWSKPLVDSVVMPAHAQSSVAGSGSGTGSSGGAT